MATTPLPALGSKERRLLDRDFRDTLKSLKNAWKDGRQAMAAQCAHDLSRMAIDPQDWLAQSHPEGK